MCSARRSRANVGSFGAGAGSSGHDACLSILEAPFSVSDQGVVPGRARGFWRGEAPFSLGERGFGIIAGGFGPSERGLGPNVRGLERSERGFQRSERGFEPIERGFERSERVVDVSAARLEDVLPSFRHEF
jgi:hypothetical protein